MMAENPSLVTHRTTSETVRQATGNREGSDKSMSDVQSGQAREMDGDRVADSDVGCSRQQQNEKNKTKTQHACEQFHQQLISWCKY